MAEETGMPGWMTGGSMALGGLSDIFSFIQNQRQSDRQRQLYALLQNPEALAAHINRMYQPLSQAGQESVSRMVQSEMAMRGTADSRYADLASARAFSDVDTQRRNAVMQAYMNALGQSAGMTGSRAPIGGLQGALQQMMFLRGMGQPRQTGIAQNPAQDASADYSKTNFWSTPPATSNYDPSADYSRLNFQGP